MIYILWLTFTLLFIAAGVWLVDFDMRHGTAWSGYFFSFLGAFTYAYDYYRRHAERRRVWDLLSKRAAVVGFIAGIVSLVIFAIFVEVLFPEYNSSDYLMVLVCAGFSFFAALGYFIGWCVYFVREDKFRDSGKAASED